MIFRFHTVKPRKLYFGHAGRQGIIKSVVMIYFDKVTKIYFQGQPAAVEDITLGIEPGEFVSIVGHSGAGKTTLLKMLFAEEWPTEGSVYFGERTISELTARELLELPPTDADKPGQNSTP